MNSCTEFCERLKAIDLKHYVLPSHDELITQLHFSVDDREQGRFLGNWHDLQQRTSCGFCKLVVAAVSESAIVKANVDSSNSSSDAFRMNPDPNQPVRILIFPGEQSFRLSYPSQLELRLAFVVEDARAVHGPDTARTIHESGIQISQIKSWLKTCDEEHKTCSPDHVEEGPDPGKVYGRRKFNESATSNFRVIDLELGCVSRAALDTKYVALSYVWGNLPMFKLQADNFKQLSTIGSLEAIRKDLPKTINDAIDLIKTMNERYLWVDGLCLVQDDDDDVSLGIEMMNSIYHGSYFTIVAGSGYDANAGLPGMSQNPRGNRQVQSMTEIAPGIKMTILHSIDWHLSRSFYNKRGWTLQELVLPRRTVIFINEQVYFRCQEANWSEESWADKWSHWLDSDDSNISRIPDPSDGFMPSFWAYQKIYEEYSQRKLRSDGDALRALAGVSRPLAAGMKTSMVEGLPGYYLNHFLLFISSKGDLRRRSEFASFSWAGWEGRIMWPRENFVWFDGGGKRNWEAANILKYFIHNQIVQWSSLDSAAHLKTLTSWPWAKPSVLLELMREYLDIFSDIDHDPEKEGRGSQWHTSSGVDGDVPYWERFRHSFRHKEEDDQSIEEQMQQPKRGFSVKAFNLINGQAEFDRLIRRIGNNIERNSLFNWMAVRSIRVREALQDKSTFGPRPYSRYSAENKLYRFRPPGAAVTQTSESESETADQRVQCGKRFAEEQVANRYESNIDAYKIPNFPPYTVLQFLTISMHLILGTAAQRDRPGQSPFDRVPGIPLFSGTGQLTGSLHPDNLDLLETPGSSIECLIISRCNTPTVASALLSSDAADTKRPWKLFWILHVVWRDGIAERRGVGQVLSSALEMAVEPKPEVKLVLLG